MATFTRTAGFSAWLAMVLAGCGDGGPQTVAIEPLPAATSRIQALEFDDDADGDADRIVRFAYDETGHLVVKSTWNAVDGIDAGEPIETVTRTYDSYGRVLTITTAGQGAYAYKEVLTANYGADGRLSTTTRHWSNREWGNSTGTEVMRFAWNAQRMTEAVVEGAQPLLGRLRYGTDGRIAMIGWDDGRQVSYGWRDDGQLDHFSASDGELTLTYTLTYDGKGRLADWQVSDEGWLSAWRRFEYDASDRPAQVEVDNAPDNTTEYVFMVDAIVRVTWEGLPCQPVYEPQVPPTLDLFVTGAASAIGATLVCSNRP